MDKSPPVAALAGVGSGRRT